MIAFSSVGSHRPSTPRAIGRSRTSHHKIDASILHRGSIGIIHRVPWQILHGITIHTGSQRIHHREVRILCNLHTEPFTRKIKLPLYVSKTRNEIKVIRLDLLEHTAGKIKHHQRIFPAGIPDKPNVRL